MRILLAGGGSGGHIYPALAIAEAIRRLDPDAEVAYAGTDHGLERELVPRAGLPFYAIHAAGLLVPGIRGKVYGLWQAQRGLWEAMALIRRLRPRAVVGTGGYVAGPVGLAAVLSGIPLVLQEQNAWPGFTNRTLARFARHVFVPFERARQHLPARVPVTVVPNPVRLEGAPARDAARAALGIAPEWTVLMVTGGSQGAAALNRFVLHHLDAFRHHADWALLWATGRRYHAEVQAALRRAGEAIDPKRVQVVEYFYEIARCYRAADLFLGRAGAMTLADLTAHGLASVLVPSPNVVGDHQTENARAMEAAGAARVVPEAALERGAWRLVAELMQDGARRQAMAQAARALYDPEAGLRMARIILEVAKAA
ncbi:MAG: undecaprenyldiphospho-muramoylpentapeptide beta-N-acetylglucosaminyltransferase [Firmicutes bacterium]|nr:undecaprenyldiphospho-muramoylpentapeptide beta-N-acetylglucosaminyltransferase [Alicyclobacillaceae bacterium]MCL6497783.1 undecaprenyldiphospho-muramoylpentapeptide beta-N-acetylglucosaminyltransferase [Bacillota bacterium]